MWAIPQIKSILREALAALGEDVGSRAVLYLG